jgi:hypothetical protein
MDDRSLAEQSNYMRLSLLPFWLKSALPTVPQQSAIAEAGFGRHNAGGIE